MGLGASAHAKLADASPDNPLRGGGPRSLGEQRFPALLALSSSRLAAVRAAFNAEVHADTKADTPGETLPLEDMPKMLDAGDGAAGFGRSRGS
jgi:hypothetical protein